MECGQVTYWILRQSRVEIMFVWTRIVVTELERNGGTQEIFGD